LYNTKYFAAITNATNVKTVETIPLACKNCDMPDWTFVDGSFSNDKIPVSDNTMYFVLVNAQNMQQVGPIKNGENIYIKAYDHEDIFKGFIGITDRDGGSGHYMLLICTSNYPQVYASPNPKVTGDCNAKWANKATGINIVKFQFQLKPFSSAGPIEGQPLTLYSVYGNKHCGWRRGHIENQGGWECSSTDDDFDDFLFVSWVPRSGKNRGVVEKTYSPFPACDANGKCKKGTCGVEGKVCYGYETHEECQAHTDCPSGQCCTRGQCETGKVSASGVCVPPGGGGGGGSGTTGGKTGLYVLAGFGVLAVIIILLLLFMRRKKK
jgi:hypothetical protein